jgi:hypothetical protein
MSSDARLLNEMLSLKESMSGVPDAQPRSGDRMQPRVQALGGRRGMAEPKRGERNESTGDEKKR